MGISPVETFAAAGVVTVGQSRKAAFIVLAKLEHKNHVSSNSIPFAGVVLHLKTAVFHYDWLSSPATDRYL